MNATEQDQVLSVLQRLLRVLVTVLRINVFYLLIIVELRLLGVKLELVHRGLSLFLNLPVVVHRHIQLQLAQVAFLSNLLF